MNTNASKEAAGDQTLFFFLQNNILFGAEYFCLESP
jgi:hypothetical protein